MAKPGKFICKLFKDKEVHIIINCFGGESLDFSQFTVDNPNFVSGIVVQYDEECGVLELKNHINQSFYVVDTNIDMFYGPDFNLISSINTVINTGRKTWVSPSKK